MNTASAPRPYVPESAQVARSLLAELKGAHHNLLAEIHNLELLTQEPDLDQTRCMSARWKISQASLSRRTLATRICDYFLAHSDENEMQLLAALQAADRDLLRASASHVEAWSSQAIAGDWPGYCAASRQIRERMHEHLSMEQSLLYPLLERSAQRD